MTRVASVVGVLLLVSFVACHTQPSGTGKAPPDTASEEDARARFGSEKGESRRSRVESAQEVELGAAKQRAETNGVGSVKKSDAEWRDELSPEEFRVCRMGGTEKAFSGKYWDHKDKGFYVCTACGNKLFSSDTKYKSGSGWPSYWDAFAANAVTTRADNSYGMSRTEIVCGRCEAHLGHVFTDGPKPTGLRYCVNSVVLDFVPDDIAGTEKPGAEVPGP